MQSTARFSPWTATYIGNDIPVFIHPTLMALVLSSLFFVAAGVSTIIKRRGWRKPNETHLFMRPIAVAFAATALFLIITRG